MNQDQTSANLQPLINKVQETRKQLITIKEQICNINTDLDVDKETISIVKLLLIKITELQKEENDFLEILKNNCPKKDLIHFPNKNMEEGEHRECEDCLNYVFFPTKIEN